MKAFFTLLGIVAMIGSVFFGEDADKLSPRQAIEAAAPYIQVRANPTTLVPAAMSARLAAGRLQPAQWTYTPDALTIHGRGRKRTYRPQPRSLHLPKDFEAACVAFSEAWTQAALLLPRDRNLNRAADAGHAAWDDALRHIDESYRAVRAVARQYGVRMPSTWARI